MPNTEPQSEQGNSHEITKECQEACDLLNKLMQRPECQSYMFAGGEAHTKWIPGNVFIGGMGPTINTNICKPVIPITPIVFVAENNSIRENKLHTLLENMGARIEDSSMCSIHRHRAFTVYFDDPNDVIRQLMELEQHPDPVIPPRDCSKDPVPLKRTPADRALHSEPQRSTDTGASAPAWRAEERHPPIGTIAPQQPVSKAVLPIPPLFKICVLGAQGAGKTHLVSRYVNDNSGHTAISHTTPIALVHKEDQIDGLNIKSQVWLLYADKQHPQVRNDVLIKGCKGILLLFDVTNRHSFEEVSKFLRWIQQGVLEQDASIILVGTKCDCDSDRQVTSDEAQRFAKLHSLTYFETSAKDNYNVQAAFHHIIRPLLTLYKRNFLLEVKEKVSNKACWASQGKGWLSLWTTTPEYIKILQNATARIHPYSPASDVNRAFGQVASVIRGIDMDRGGRSSTTNKAYLELKDLLQNFEGSRGLDASAAASSNVTCRK